MSADISTDEGADVRYGNKIIRELLAAEHCETDLRLFVFIRCTCTYVPCFELI